MYYIIMNELTIIQAKEYAGYSYPTWLKWLDKGIVKGRKGEGEKDAWFIPADEVEKIRLQRFEQLQKEIEAISIPVPMGK